MSYRKLILNKFYKWTNRGEETQTQGEEIFYKGRFILFIVFGYGWQHNKNCEHFFLTGNAPLRRNYEGGGGGNSVFSHNFVT